MPVLSMDYLESCGLAAFFFVLWYIFIRRTEASARLGKRLPGPKGIPVVGNILDIPEKNQWTAFAEWKTTFGESSTRFQQICR